MIVYIVVNGAILGGYTRRHIAETHARTVTGGTVRELEVLDRLPESVRDDLSVGGELDDDDDEPTPAPLDIRDVTQTRPDTPRAKAKAKRRR